MLARTLLASLLLSSTAHAVGVSFSGWVTNNGAYLQVPTSPTTSAQALLPSYLSFDGDPDAGTLTIHGWDVYNDASSAVIYALGSHTISNFTNTMDDFDPDWRGTLTTPEGDWGVIWHRYSEFDPSSWTLNLTPLTSWTVDAVALTFEPLRKPFRIERLDTVGEVPEPSAIVLAGGCLAAIAGWSISGKRTRSGETPRLEDLAHGHAQPVES